MLEVCYRVLKECINEKGKLSDRAIKGECLKLEKRVGPEPEIAHSRIP